jgi:hypothetical protein
MTTQQVFETTYNGNAGTVSARPMIRYYDEKKGHYWGHKQTSKAWDYSLDITENHALAVRYSCRVALQKDPVSIEWGGESVRGKLWIVTVTS